MEIRSNDKIYIIAPLSEKLGQYETNRIKKEIFTETSCENIALDLARVSDCSIDFIETLKELSKSKKIGVFNIASDVFALFNYMNLDKNVNLFVSELDFIENARQIINRKFQLV